ncbi:uncharacterized protein LOC126765340 isoform X2 [Bactrocera neohumeralis]|uniref:uncharacterized protein LOC126765340 isoform X2 n=1 Tax=Bactrocera neohumeralis TaxID=98809 RepID=UPI00216559AB|nr:uncharacterized protein LOC126765340 isoform X2 [Bactrocera neohumeralis]
MQSILDFLQEAPEVEAPISCKVLQMCPHFNQLKHIFGKKATSELPLEVVDSGSTSIMNESAASQILEITFSDVGGEIASPIDIANTENLPPGKFQFLSRQTKTQLYKSLIIPVLLYGAESWTMSTTDESTLRVFERKVLRKIFGPLRVSHGEYRIRWNDELYEIYDDIDIVQRIKRQRLHWLGQVVRRAVVNSAIIA